MIRRPPRSTPLYSSAASDVYKRQLAIGEIDHHLALAHHRLLVLADLIALRQIGIEIVLPVEHRLEIDLRLQPEPRADRLADAFLIDHRQHAGHRGVDQRDMAVGRAAEFGRGAGEQLRVRGDLGMNFHADDDFPVAARAFNELDGFALHVHDATIYRGRGRQTRVQAGKYESGESRLSLIHISEPTRRTPISYAAF